MSFNLCTVSNRNTGGIKCDVSRGVLSKPFIFNDDYEVGDVNTPQTFLAALIASSILGKNESGKVFPMPNVEEITNKAEANKEGTLALGFKQILFEGRPAYEIKFFAGNVQLKALRAYNNKTVGLLEYDRNKNMWGTVSGTKFKGFSAKVFFTGGDLATGQNVEEGVVTMTISILDVNEYRDNNYYMPIEGNITDIKGLVDVEGYVFSQATNVVKIGYRLQTSQLGKYINMFDNFEDELADAGLYLAYSVGADGVLTPLAITSVVKDAVNHVYTFTLNATAYGLLAPGTPIKIFAVNPATLEANDITDVELDPVILAAA